VIPGLEGDTRNPEYLPGKRAQSMRRQASKSRWDWAKSSLDWKSANSALPEVLPVPSIAKPRTSIAIIFAGPSLPPSARPIDPCLVWRPPVQRDDIYHAALDRPTAIGIIDGRFDAVPSVRHREIAWAIERGIRVYGAASMGALRAAELADFGMKGVGRVFQWYRDGTLVDDGDVAVVHGPEELDYVQLSTPTVNLEATIQKAVRAGVLDQKLATLVIACARSVNYQTRTLSAVFRSAADRGVPQAILIPLREWIDTGWTDQKRLDSEEMIQVIRHDLRSSVQSGLTAGRIGAA
jgi:hypothetical protein